MELEDKRIIVTGAARGIGADTVRGYVAAGAQVAALDVRDQLGEELARELGETRCRYLHCDVSIKAEVDAAFSAGLQWLRGLDVLVNAAGFDRPGYAAEDIPEEVWESIFGTCAKGTFLTNQAAFRAMRPAGGRIINFGSVAGIRGMGERAAYSAAKGAVHAWSRAAAQAWGASGVTVNVIAPIMLTDVARRYYQTLGEAARAERLEDFRKRVPLGRHGEAPQDLVPLMIFLAGEGSRYITGQVFSVDGGMTMLGS